MDTIFKLSYNALKEETKVVCMARVLHSMVLLRLRLGFFLTKDLAFIVFRVSLGLHLCHLFLELQLLYMSICSCPALHVVCNGYVENVVISAFDDCKLFTQPEM